MSTGINGINEEQYYATPGLIPGVYYRGGSRSGQSGQVEGVMYPANSRSASQSSSGRPTPYIEREQELRPKDASNSISGGSGGYASRRHDGGPQCVGEADAGETRSKGGHGEAHRETTREGRYNPGHGQRGRARRTAEAASEHVRRQLVFPRRHVAAPWRTLVDRREHQRPASSKTL